MIFHLSRVEVDRPIGRVADFCTFCRRFRPFQIDQVESVYRLYFAINLGGRQPDGLAKVCEVCRLRVPAVSENYQTISGDPDADINQLIAQTNPQIERNWASRLLLEQRIRERKVTAGERWGLMLEPFNTAASILDNRNKEERLDPPSRFGCLATFAVPILCMAILPQILSLPRNQMEKVVVIIAGCCLAFTVLAIATDAQRHARRAVLPRLIDSLRPLNPSDDEIQNILEGLQAEGSNLPNLISARDITAGLMHRHDSFD